MPESCSVCGAVMAKFQGKGDAEPKYICPKEKDHPRIEADRKNTAARVRHAEEMAKNRRGRPSPGSGNRGKKNRDKD